jgi:hypothetical protein
MVVLMEALLTEEAVTTPTQLWTVETTPAGAMPPSTAGRAMLPLL